MVKIQALILHAFALWVETLCRSKRAMCFSCVAFGLRIFYLGEIMSFEFGEHLKDLRFETDYTQEDIAKLLCIDRTTYTKYETGVSEPNLEILKRLCDIFEVDFNTLMDY